MHHKFSILSFLMSTILEDVVMKIFNGRKTQSLLIGVFVLFNAAAALTFTQELRAAPIDADHPCYIEGHCKCLGAVCSELGDGKACTSQSTCYIE